MNPSDEPRRPGKIIIPGAESSAPEEPARGPAGDAPGEAGGPSRIILPPGAAPEQADDLPEYPKMRPLVLVPFSDGKRELLLVNDPLGVIPGQPVLGMEALPLLQMLDGSLSLTDLSAMIMRENKDIRVANMVRDFVADLDRLLMLDSPRFEDAYRELRETYHPLEIRPAALEGRAYPAARAELETFLKEHVTAAEAMRAKADDPVAAPDARPRALMAPHLDPRRAGPTIARAMMELGVEQKEPLRVVVFGTGHSLIGDTVALTRKHFETPLGKVECDTAFVDAVARRMGDLAYRSELAHRDEHSIEFQALYLRQRFGDRQVRIVPILCGGFHALVETKSRPTDDVAIESLVRGVREAEQELGGATVYLAGVDFSHVGPRFGDPAVDERVKGEIEEKDRAAIAAAQAGDAEAWYDAIAAHGDSTRICGFAPTYAMLRCADVKDGRLLHYTPSEEQDGSLVSVAAMTWD